MPLHIPVPEKTYQLPPPSSPVPAETYYSHLTNAMCFVGDDALAQIDSARGCNVAVDIETRGIEKFFIRCVTAAWDVGGEATSIFLDPRFDHHAQAIRALFDGAKTLVLHNAVYDVPPLYQAGLMSFDHINKVIDTLVLARMINTYSRGGKSLEELTHTLLPEFPDNRYKIADAFTTAGTSASTDPETGEKYSSSDMGFITFNHTNPVWRVGAMADTVATLRILPKLWQSVLEHYAEAAAIAPQSWHEESDAWSTRLIMREQITNRVMLRRSAVGIAVDTDYAHQYKSKFESHLASLEAPLIEAGINPDAGNVDVLVIQYLFDRGQLPSDWPETPKGKLKSDKDTRQRLAHLPIVAAVDEIKQGRKVLGYLDKLLAMERVTGRVHPEACILGAHTTGRMSYRSPELQQFPKDARPMLRADEGRGLTSIDWSAIEPVLLANVAHDFEYLQNFDRGGDLYIPSAKIAGLIPADLDDEAALQHPGRSHAKTIVLANMYGQGREVLAENLGVSEDEAVHIKSRYNAAMQPTVHFLRNVKRFATEQGFIRTIDGRRLSVPEFNGAFVGYKAQNYIVQGTAYSMMSETINNIERAGLGDAIYIAVHDELVVDTEAAPEIQHIMEQSPDWLINKAGRVPVIRTDSNDMKESWQYV